MRIKKFINEAELHNQVKLGGYTWSKIGEWEEYYIYLCDDIVIKGYPKDDPYDLEFIYNKFPDKVKSSIVDYILEGDYHIGILDSELYDHCKNNIKNINSIWWYRDYNQFTYDYLVYPDGSEQRYDGQDIDGTIGVRPIFLTKTEIKIIDTQKIKELLKDIKDAYAHYKSLCNDLIEAGGDEEDIDKIIHDVNRVL